MTGCFRTTCRKCGKPVLIWRAGRATVRDADGRRLVVVATVTEVAG